MVSPTICPYPFVHQQIQPDGEIRFCCAARPNSNQDSNGNVYFVTKDKLIDAWNSESIKKLRLELINGEKPVCCSHCWIRENDDNTSGTSMRLDYIQNNVPVENIKDRIEYAKNNNGALEDKPYDFQVMTGNLCNLACKMCTPQYSTNFSKFFRTKGFENLKDITFNKNHNRFNIYQQHYNKTYDWPVAHPLKDTFADYFDSIREVFLLGGEPTLLDGTLEFLESLKEKNLNDKVLVRLSTNGTNVNQRLLQSLEGFNQVRINVSIDGMDEIAYIQRTPSNWSMIKSNLDDLTNWANKSESRNIVLHSVMTSLNFHHIIDFWQFICKNYKSNLFLSLMPVLEEDDNFTLSIVPGNIAQEMKLKLRDFENSLSEDRHKQFSLVIYRFKNILDHCQFSINNELIHFQLDQLQKIHPEMDIKKIYSIYYKDSL